MESAEGVSRALRQRYDYVYRPAAGVKTDFEDILWKFVDTETVRYEQFAELWREKKMALIFSGRQNEKEAREFAEECLRIALQYALPPYNFQVRVGALYLIYGLFNTQPCITKARVRVTPEMWREIIEFQNEAHRQQHLDVDYVFHKLRVQDAFVHVATIQPYGVSRDDKEEDASLPDEFREEQSVMFDLFSSEVLEQLGSIHQHYHRMKVALNGEDASAPSQSLSVIRPELVQNISSAMVTYQQRRKQAQNFRKRKQNEDDEEVEEEDNEEDDPTYKPLPVTSKKSRIKERAFQSAPKKSRRHIGQGESSASATEESPVKKKKGKGKKKRDKSVREEPELSEIYRRPNEDKDTEKAEENPDKDAVFNMPLIVPQTVKSPAPPDSSSPKQSKKKNSPKKGPKQKVTIDVESLISRRKEKAKAVKQKKKGVRKR